MKSINILFHGASVTAQGGESSYLHQLEKLLKQNTTDNIDSNTKPRYSLKITKKGYGGSHFGDAGFLTLDNDTIGNIDICLLEWNTTSQSAFEEAKLQYMVDLLKNKGIITIFLILARTDNLTSDTSRMCERQVTIYCQENSIGLLDYRSLIEPELDLRDNVHTNTRGACKYAEKLNIDIRFITDNFKQQSPVGPATKLRYCVSADQGINMDIQEGATIRLNFSGISNGAHLIVGTIKGPSSAIIEVNFNKKICIWDQWSHYERSGFQAISHEFCEVLEGRGHVEISVLSDKIDYSVCKRVFSYSGIKYFKIRGIFAVNCVFDFIS